MINYSIKTLKKQISMKELQLEEGVMSEAEEEKILSETDRIEKLQEKADNISKKLKMCISDYTELCSYLIEIDNLKNEK